MTSIDRNLIRNIPNFPIAGIEFKDITPLLSNADNFAKVISLFAAEVKNSNFLVGIEARGFIFAAATAEATNKGFIPIRKSGKLPGEVEKQSYQLEYGEASIEIHKGIYPAGSSVTIIDDVLATGGTAIAAVELCEKINLKVNSVVFLLEIPGLGGRSQISEQYPDLQISILLAE